MYFLPTLNEFLEENKNKSEFETMVDDFSEFPEESDLFALRLQAIQRIDDIVMFHRFVMVTHENNQQVIKPEFDSFNKHYKGMFDSIEENESAKIATTRLVFQPFDVYVQQDQIKSIANESLVINLWATIEQYANHCLQFVTSDSSSRSHRWPDVINKFLEQQLDIKSLGSYSTIDEMRVLNNKIKHLYHVDSNLASFEYFEEHAGKKISNVPLRVQDYTLATYHYICQLINSTGPSVQY